MGFFTKKEQIAILGIVLVIISALGFKYIKGNDKELANVPEIHGLIINENEESILEEKKELIIHITGQVYNPGIYKMYEGDRVIDAVKKAGGFTSKAYEDGLNLAKKVYDEEKIIVPMIGEEIQVGSEFSNQQISGKININNCTKEQLIQLPGIGEVIASRIIEYRTNNRFNSIEDILNVSGIGDAKFEDIKELITAN